MKTTLFLAAVIASLTTSCVSVKKEAATPAPVSTETTVKRESSSFSNYGSVPAQSSTSSTTTIQR